MCKFQIGDRIIGIATDQYTITKKGWEGFVEEVHDHYIHVRPADGFNGDKGGFNVDPIWFELIPGGTSTLFRTESLQSWCKTYLNN